jgi:hypothetical protein
VFRRPRRRSILPCTRSLAAIVWASVSERFMYILFRWTGRPTGSTTKCIGAKPRVSGTAFRSLPRHADISHSANDRKYHQCIGGKSPGPMLTCAAAHAMHSKRRGVDGNSQAQFRSGVREASAGDVLAAQRCNWGTSAMTEFHHFG